MLKTYRIANGDTSYTRYERLIPGAVARWLARSTDDTVSLYGETGLITNKCEIDDFYAPLTRTTDVFGNEVKYEYTASLNPECRITKITWGQNAGAGMPNPFAQVLFNWQAGHVCPGSSNLKSGAQLDYRIGRLVLTGASKLTSIVATAFPPESTTPDHTRTIALTYTNDDTDCAAPHSPVRLRSRIQESAVGTDSPLVTLPAVEFDYGDPAVTLNTASTQPPWYDPTGNANNLAWGYRFTDDRTPTIEAMLLDFDGDGLLDRVFNTSNPGSNGACTMQWQRNLGVQSGTVSTLHGFFGGLSPVITLPRLKWRGNATLPASSATADTTNAKEGCQRHGRSGWCARWPRPIASRTQPLKEQTKIRVDGLGRTIEHWETTSDDGSNFFLYQRQATSYVDTMVGSVPTSSTHQVRQNTNANSTWTNVKTELDGHGRPIRTTELAQGTAPNDAITSFVYANDGTLQSVSVPDPTQNNASTVSYRYTFDSLGVVGGRTRAWSPLPAFSSNFVGPHPKALQGVGAEGGGDCHVSGVASPRDQHTPDARDIVARIERVPLTSKVGLEPACEVHESLHWHSDVSEIASAIARGNVHAATQRDGQMSEVATHPRTFLEDLPGRLARTRRGVAERDVLMDKIADRLDAPPARRSCGELLPGQLRQPLRLAVPATEQEHQRLLG